MSDHSSEQEEGSSSVAVEGELRPQRRFSDPSHSTSSSQKTDNWRCSLCDYENSDDTRQCALCGTKNVVPSTATTEIGDSDAVDASQPPSTALIASLRVTADSVSERLLTLAKTSDDDVGFLDNAGDSSTPLYSFPVSQTSTGIIFSDDNSSTPIPAPDDSSIDEIFRGRLFTRPEEKEEVIPPQSPPHVTRIGFEALPASPQIQPQPQSMEQQWEMPPHFPDLTATGTPVKNASHDGDDNSVASSSPAQRLIRLLVCSIVAITLFLSIWFVQDRDKDNVTAGPGIRVSSSPTFSPAPESYQPTLWPSSSPGPSTFYPTSASSLQPPSTVDFTPQAIFQGSMEGVRLGTSVSIDRSGTFLASLDGAGNVKLYHALPNGWELLSAIFSPQEVDHMDMVVVDEVPILAMASRVAVQILQYRNDDWNSLGIFEWTAEDITAPTVSLSANGKAFAMASLENGGDNWSVQVWELDDSWLPKGNAVVQYASSNSFLSLSLDLSGDATTFAVGDWRITNPAVTVQAYAWNGQEWIPKGSTPSFLWGPSDVALTDDGNCFAVATPTPGTARVYHWNETFQDWDIIGSDLIGGSSIDLSENGRRVMVGSPLTSTVVIYDLSPSEEWEASSLLSGNIGDQFGASISMAGDGNTLVVGSPLDDEGGRNAGKFLVYT